MPKPLLFGVACCGVTGFANVADEEPGPAGVEGVANVAPPAAPGGGSDGLANRTLPGPEVDGAGPAIALAAASAAAPATTGVPPPLSAPAPGCIGVRVPIIATLGVERTEPGPPGVALTASAAFFLASSAAVISAFIAL